MVYISHIWRRFGYRRIHDLLRPEFPHVKHKRVNRLYRDSNLAVRRRKKAKRPLNERVPLQLAQTVNEVWSMDSVTDSLSNCRRIKCLTLADDFSHECVDIEVDYGISGQYVTRLLDQAANFRVYPLAVRTDNGPCVHQSRLNGFGDGSWCAPHIDIAKMAHAKRLYRDFQWQVS